MWIAQDSARGVVHLISDTTVESTNYDVSSATDSDPYDAKSEAAYGIKSAINT